MQRTAYTPLTAFTVLVSGAIAFVAAVGTASATVARDIAPATDFAASGGTLYGPDKAGEDLRVLAASPKLLAFAHGSDQFVADASGEVIRGLSASASVVQVNGSTVLLREHVSGHAVPCYVAESAAGDASRTICSAGSAAVFGSEVVYTSGGKIYRAGLTGTPSAVQAFNGVIDSEGARGMVLVSQTQSGPRADYVRYGALADGTSASSRLVLPVNSRFVTCPSVALSRALCRVGLNDGSEWPVLLDLNGGQPTVLSGSGYVGGGYVGGYVSNLVVSEHTSVWSYQSGKAYWKNLDTGAVAQYSGGYTGLVTAGDLLVGSTASDVFTLDGSGKQTSVDVRVPGAPSRAPSVVSPEQTFTVTSGRAFLVSWKTAAQEDGTRYTVKWRKAGTSDWQVWKKGVVKGSAQFGASGNPVRPVAGATYEFKAVAVDAFGQSDTSSVRASRLAHDQNQGTARGGWKTLSVKDSWLGSVVQAKKFRSSFEFSTAAGRVSVLGATVSNGARFAVYVDGVKVEVVSSRSSATQVREVIWSGRVSGAGKHTVRLVKLGDASSRLVIDGFDTP